VVGYDNSRQYLEDTKTSHTYFGAVIGRIANRIKNGTFELDGDEYHIPKNHDVLFTLHAGDIAYDQRNWTVVASTRSSVTFELYDAAFQGFPDDVKTEAICSVDTKATAENPQGRPRLTTKMVSQALNRSTPIMLSNHIY
jgi:aldose 1-epimerase